MPVKLAVVVGQVAARRYLTQPGTGQGGFAYLWVLMLVGFMGLGLSLALDIYATAVRRDQERELLAIGRQFRAAIARYHEAAQGNAPREYPRSLEELLLDPRSAGVRRHLRKIFVDPLTGKAEWGEVRVDGRIVGVYSLSQRLPIKQDRFEAEDTGFRGKQKYSEWVFTYPANLLQSGAPAQTANTAPGAVPGNATMPPEAAKP